MKKSEYYSPESEILELGICQIICQGSLGKSVTFGDEGRAGAEIDEDSYVNGGNF